MPPALETQSLNHWTAREVPPTLIITAGVEVFSWGWGRRRRRERVGLPRVLADHGEDNQEHVPCPQRGHVAAPHSCTHVSFVHKFSNNRCAWRGAGRCPGC